MCKLNLMLSHGVEILLKGETSIFLSGIGNRLCRKKKILRKYWLNHLKCLSNIHDPLNITFKTVLALLNKTNNLASNIVLKFLWQLHTNGHHIKFSLKDNNQDRVSNI